MSDQIIYLLIELKNGILRSRMHGNKYPLNVLLTIQSKTIELKKELKTVLPKCDPDTYTYLFRQLDHIFKQLELYIKTPSASKINTDDAMIFINHIKILLEEVHKLLPKPMPH